MTTIFFCTVHFISQSNIALSSVELLFYASRSMIPFGIKLIDCLKMTLGRLTFEKLNQLEFEFSGEIDQHAVKTKG